MPKSTKTYLAYTKINSQTKCREREGGEKGGAGVGVGAGRGGGAMTIFKAWPQCAVTSRLSIDSISTAAICRERDSSQQAAVRTQSLYES